MSTNILVVDDEADLEPLIKLKFRRKIREGFYNFQFAHNGEQALTYLHQHPDTDIVLSDIRMPVMDGLTLLAKLPEVSPVLKAIMVSAFNDMDNIRLAMNRGAFDFVCKPVDFEDLEATIEKTADHVRHLRKTLRAVQENSILKMYVDETVLKFMARPEFENRLLVSETIEATILFIDICRFTTLAEKLPADVVIRLLNTYFDVMVREITSQSGYVDKFMGDAIMAVFRGEFHLDRAVEAALAVRAALQASPAVPLPDGSLYHPNVSVGVSTGEVVLGNIGSSSLKRFDYTVIGDVVNLGQRLQAAALPGQILLSESASHQLKEAFQCAPLKEMHLKNKAKPVMVYQVVA